MNRYGEPRSTWSRVEDGQLIRGIGSLRQWKSRAVQLRRHLLICLGLWPMPERTPLNVSVFDRSDYGRYTVEKVFFQSMPGVYVTGNLYRPAGNFRRPAILNPHGHWPNGRLEDSESASISGRCINFAHQGYVAFSYSMVGYNDNDQFGEVNDLHVEGVSALQNDLWGISLCGLQTWNSIRSIDFLQTLPDVNPARIACTGESGGGTQTFLLGAVDDRVKVCAPVNMVSGYFHGGCICENPPLLRLETNNVEIAAMFAPRPMLMVSTSGDWTSTVPEVEFQAVRRVYELFGAPEKVGFFYQEAPHNYNKLSREAVYNWFGRWLPSQPLETPIGEVEFIVPEREQLLVPSEAKKDALDVAGYERRVVSDRRELIAAYRPDSREALDRFSWTFRPLLAKSLGLTWSRRVGAVSKRMVENVAYLGEEIILDETSRGARIPGFLFSPANQGECRRKVLLLHPEGRRHYCEDIDMPGELIQSLLDRGFQVLAIDCFGVGDQGAGERLQECRHRDTYNPSVLGERAFDIVAAAAFLGREKGNRVSIVGDAAAGLWAMLAIPFATAVDAGVVDADGFDTAADVGFTEDLYSPLLRKAGDFGTAVALSAPRRLHVHNTAGVFAAAAFGTSAYKALGEQHMLTVSEEKAESEVILRILNSA